MTDEELLRDYLMNHDEVKKMVDKEVKEDKILRMYNEFVDLNKEKEEKEKAVEQEYIDTIKIKIEDAKSKEEKSKIKKDLQEDFFDRKISGDLYAKIIKMFFSRESEFREGLAVKEVTQQKNEENNQSDTKDENTIQIIEDEKGEERE